MSLQTMHASIMKESFQPIDWKVYGEYFECFQEHLQKNFSFPTKAVMQFYFIFIEFVLFKLFRINYVGTTYRFWTPVYLGIVAYE